MVLQLTERRIGANVSRWRSPRIYTCLLAICFYVSQPAFSQQSESTLSSISGQPHRGVLSLINGDTVEGHVCSGERPDSIAWQGVHFADPFEFRLGIVRSAKFPSKRHEVEQEGPFSFELTTGDVIVGKLVGLSTEVVEIGSSSIGRVAVRANLLRRIHRIDNNSSVTFSSLRGMEGWRNEDVLSDGWLEDGDHIWTGVPGSVVSENLELPERAVVDFELSWNGAPDFVVSIGADPEPTGDSGRKGWRLETFDNGLAAVGEDTDTADVIAIADLSKLGRLRLMVYLDQNRKTMEVLRADGVPIGKISLARNVVTPVEAVESPAASDVHRGIRIINRGESLRLERLHIAKWVGNIPSGESRGQASIALADGDIVSGAMTRFDSAENRLELGGPSQNRFVDLANVVAIRFAPNPSSADPGQCALFLHGGMRLSGQLMNVDENGWVLGGDHFQREVRLSHDLVRTLVVFESESANIESKPVIGRVGRLEIGSDRLSGRLMEDDSTASPGAFPIRWHPLNSATSARIRADVMGRVVYREPPKIDSQSAAARMLAQQRLRSQQQRRGLNFGELFLQRADLSKSSPIKRDAHVIHLRSGDVIACRVDAIDENGVVLSTANSDRGFVPHERIKAIEFVSNSPPPNLDDAKRERLLTIPRLQKSAPPSHLLCSHNGDFLRCRLLGSQDDLLRVEIQQEEFLVPRNRIAQIIWFHSDEASEADEPGGRVNESRADSDSESVADADSGYQGVTQVVLSDGKRVTFTPTGVREGAVLGTSPWVGPCRFDLGSVDQLLLGNQIEVDVADVAYNRWKLHPAVEPLVTEAMQGDGSGASASQSPLVGLDAPEFKLSLLDGEPFVLSECKGQIVILDFWASWSAPCMQTMPLVIEAVDQFDPTLVRHVSVNLQESSDQIRSVLTRQQFATTVALDIDGVAAERYQTSVIPQLVVIGSDGKVKGLFVGGGPEVVARMTTCVRELLEPPVDPPQ